VPYLKAALVGLFGGVLLTAAALAVQVVYVEKAMAAQMASCEAESTATTRSGICFGYVRFREWMVPVAFGIGFTGAFFWLLRRQQRLVA
jgi:hypothetical protein